MMNNVKIPNKLRKKIDEELQPAESIRWIEQPIPRVFTARTIWYSFWGFFMTIFSIVQILVYLSLFEVDFFYFVLVFLWLCCFFYGVYLLLTPYRRWLKARNTVYLVTDKRAISIRSIWSTKTKSYFPNQLKDLYYQKKANGTGDVILELQPIESPGPSKHVMYCEIGFMAIRKPIEVVNMLKQLK